MTFVFYKEGKKYTINNATLYDASDYFPDTYLITSTRGSINEDNEIIDNKELLQEVKEGIAWFHESIN
jgi:hypothetical protein